MAQSKVPPDSLWFEGHFPGEPVLPGIAQLAMVFDIIDQFIEPEITVTGIRRVRFKRIIRPAETLSILARPAKNRSGDYAFRISVETELVCSGVMSVAKRVQPPAPGDK